MLGHGVWAEAQSLGDLAVREALNDAQHNLALARRQGRQRQLGDLGLIALKLQYSDHCVPVPVGNAGNTVEQAGATSNQLNVGVVREAAASTGTREQFVEVLLTVHNLREQPPGGVI